MTKEKCFSRVVALQIRGNTSLPKGEVGTPVPGEGVLHLNEPLSSPHLHLHKRTPAPRTLIQPRSAAMLRGYA